MARGSNNELIEQLDLDSNSNSNNNNKNSVVHEKEIEDCGLPLTSYSRGKPAGGDNNRE